MPPDLNTAFDGSSDPYSALRHQIQRSLQKAEIQKTQLKSNALRYTVINLTLSAVATLIAGGSAIAGTPLLGDWRSTTFIVSACALGAAIAAGIHKQVAPPERLLESSECAVKLRNLVVETISETYELETVSEAYQHILSEFTQIDCY